MSEILDTPISVSASQEGSVSSPSYPKLDYARYICIPKSMSSTLLVTLEKLGKMAASLSAKNVVVRSTQEKVLFVYDNTFYKFEFEVPNLTGLVLSEFCISIDHLKRFFSVASSYLTLVEEVESSAVRAAGFYVLVGNNLVFVETQQYDPMVYQLEWPEFTDELCGEYLAKGLAQFTSLLSLAERAPEKQLITSGGSSYINISSIFGRAKSFFGEGRECIINRVLVDCIGTLAAFDGSDVRASFSDKNMSICFGTSARLLFAYTTGAVVGRFMSPVFKDAFRYESTVHIDQSEFSGLLSLVSSLDYFANMVTVQFTPEQLQLTVHQQDDKDMTYSFNYRDGSTNSGTLVVPLDVLLGVLSNVTSDAAYSCNGNSLVIDTGQFVYCIRSVMS